MKGTNRDPMISDPEPLWVHDQRHLLEEFGSAEGPDLLERIAATYLTEAASEMVAIAVLLRADQVRATLEPLVRAVVERMGHLNWVLDHRISLRSRVIRTYLEVGVSYQHLRLAFARLGLPGANQKALRTKAVRIREFLSDNFEVDTSASTDNPLDLTCWDIEGDRYPTFERSAHLAFESSNLSPARAKGAYAALSGYSHPSIVFSAEHQFDIDDGRTSAFVYGQEELENLVGLALVAYLQGFAHWLGYYHDLEEEGPIHHRMNGIAAAFDAISVFQ
jgi:hypothetical protein